jgi:O-antigen/teichoic acid export membrane protein
VLSICSQWIIRHKLFKLSSQVIIAQSLVINILKVVAGFVAPFGKTLIILSIVGTFFYSIALYLAIKFKARKECNIPARVGFDRGIAKEYISFPKYRTPQGVLTNINQSLPVILLAGLFGAIPAGLYTLCRGTLIIPTNLIAKSINDVLFPKINETYIDKKPISPLIIKATWVLALLALLPLSVFVYFGPDIFNFVFGSDWLIAGVLSQWLALRFYFSFINRACVAAIPVLCLEKFLLINSLLNLLLSTMGFYVGYSFFSSYVYAIALHSLFGIISQVLIITFVIVSARNYDKQLNDSLNR